MRIESPLRTPLDAWWRYLADLSWRSVTTMDTLRQRADNMLAHQAAGMPPLLHFEAEAVADAHGFSPPCNYRLLRVTRCGSDRLEEHVQPGAAPVGARRLGGSRLPAPVPGMSPSAALICVNRRFDADG